MYVNSLFAKKNESPRLDRSQLTYMCATTACVGINLAQMELRLGVTRFFRKFPNASVSRKEGMSDLDMKQRAYVFMSPVSHRCLIDA